MTTRRTTQYSAFFLSCLFFATGLLSNSHAADYGIRIGNSISQSLSLDSLKKGSGVPWVDGSEPGPESAYDWVRLHRQCDSIVKPKYAIIVTRYHFITWKAYRITNNRTRVNYYKDKIYKVIGTDTALKTEYEATIKGERNVFDFDEQNPLKSGPWNFKDIVAASFLPLIIRDAKAAGTKLIILKNKSYLYTVEPQLETPEMKQYNKDLADYLNANGVIYLDYVQSNIFTKADYGGEWDDHLGPTGAVKWSNLIKIDMQAISEGKKAPLQMGTPSTRILKYGSVMTSPRNNILTITNGRMMRVSHDQNLWNLSGRKTELK